MAKRLYALDVSRGLAALGLVLWHWQHFAYNENALPQDFDSTRQPLYAVLKLFYERGAMCVEYFFLLSSFIFFWLYRSSIENKGTSFWSFWVQRISRLYPLHLITLIIVALLQSVYLSHHGHSFIYLFNNTYHFFLNLGFVSNWGLESGWSFNGPVWSVSIEIFLYFVFFIMAYHRLGRTMICLGVSVTAFVISSFTDYNIFKGLALFFIGGFVFQSTFLISTKLQILKPAIHYIAALAWLLTIVNFYVFSLSLYILKFGFIGNIFLKAFPVYILFPFSVCSLVLIEIDKGHFLKRISWIGDITYSSYLLHFPLQLIFGLAVGFGYLNFNFYLNIKLEPTFNPTLRSNKCSSGLYSD